jgi:hypothetical protein
MRAISVFPSSHPPTRKQLTGCPIAATGVAKKWVQARYMSYGFCKSFSGNGAGSSQIGIRYAQPIH